MKIGFIHTFYELRGGEDIVVEQEIDLLKKNGYDVCILPFKNPKSKFYQFLIFIFSLFNVYSFFKVYNWIKNEKLDIIHIHNWHYAASASVFWIAKLMNVPVVHTLHNYRLLCPSATLLSGGSIFLGSLGVRFPFKAVYQKVYRDSYFLTFWLAFVIRFHHFIGTWNIPSLYIALTPSMKLLFNQRFVSIDINKIIVKPNFVLFPSTQSVQRQDYFLFVGRLSKEKGIIYLLDVFKRLPLKLKIIGDGPLSQYVEETSSSHPNIVYLGYKNKDFVTNELFSCSALIFPSIWYEPFGLAIIESFACGTPVIASNIGASSELIIDNYNGLHFMPGNSIDLELKLKKWQTSNISFKRSISSNALSSYKQYYTPEINLNQLTNIYFKLA